ncbi:type II toxin-antitoxin system VapB family antitoxin [Embleya sp. NBC_00896]|uniref:type II toxin-antitoxin system VapB family antitoxin n=1 Tax=Embleya sp. NBC_00896 TaxID=2975961 RepID=UPI00386DE556|nr:hypothetical protein OG928_19300 [Embleya sp. NBC_00896]
MARTVIDVDEVDDRLLRVAAEELGTTTAEDTVNEALRQVAARAAQRRIMAGLEAGIHDELPDPEF